MSEPPRRRRFIPQFSLGTLMWLTLVAAMATAWWNDRRSFDERLKKLEGYSQPTTLWTAMEVFGPPDDLTGSAGLSWCPGPPNGAEWIELGFDRAVAAVTIDLYETYSVGCVTEVSVIDRQGTETSIWQGTDPTPGGLRTGMFKVPVPAKIKSISRVKVYTDNRGKTAWACLDAVGLTTAAGQTEWASSADCSSVYNGGATSVTRPRKWLGLW